MKWLLAAFLLFPTDVVALNATSAAQRYEILAHINAANFETDIDFNEDYKRAYETRARLLAEIGVPLDRDRRPTREPTPKELKKLSGGWLGKDQRPEYDKAVRDLAESKASQDHLRQEAIRLAVEHYGIHLKRDAGTIVSGPPEALGKAIAWDPTYISDPPTKHSAEDVPAYLGVDGKVVVRPTAFKSPEYLAWLLDHESMHVADHMSPGRDLRSEPAVERRIRLEALALENKFELDIEAWEQQFLLAAGQDVLIPLWRSLMDSGYDPYENASAFASLTISEERKEKVYKDVQSDLTLFSLATWIESLDPAVDSLEYIKARARSDFVKSMNGEELRGALNGWNRAREVNMQRHKRAAELAAAGLEFEAKQCGFHLIGSGAKTTGFQLIADPSYRFDFDPAMDIGAAKAAFLIARACIDGSEAGTVRQLCNDALGIVNQRSQDSQFWARAAVRHSGSQGFQQECLKWDGANVPLAAVEFAAGINDYWRRVEDYVRESQRAPAQGSRPVPAPDAGRPDREGSRPGLPDDCIYRGERCIKW